MKMKMKMWSNLVSILMSHEKVNENNYCTEMQGEMKKTCKVGRRANEEGKTAMKTKKML